MGWLQLIETSYSEMPQMGREGMQKDEQSTAVTVISFGFTEVLIWVITSQIRGEMIKKRMSATLLHCYSLWSSMFINKYSWHCWKLIIY